MLCGRFFPIECKRILLRRMCTAVAPISPRFITLPDSDHNLRSKPDGFRFSVVSYNILGQVYVKSSLFPHSPAPCLRWKARSQAILTVLRNLRADFLCLQELDEYDGFYKQSMETHGYYSIYVQRGGRKRDGCGIFYRPEIAELVQEEKIDYNDLINSIEKGTISCVIENSDAEVNGISDSKTRNGATSSSSDRGDPNDPRVRLKRDCVGIMAAFLLRGPAHHVVIVASTHIYWDPEWADVKLAQTKYLLSRLAQFKTAIEEKFDCTPSIILAGDFNSTPGDKVYEYIISGNSEVVPLHECLEELPMPLASVYAYSRGEPPFTNCTPDFTNTLDYIFYSPSDDIKPVSFLELPEVDSPDVVGGLPNYYHPSDHLPIGAEFELIT